MKNRDKINKMNDKELSELLSNMPCAYCLARVCCQEFTNIDLDCAGFIKLWLESEVEE